MVNRCVKLLALWVVLCWSDNILAQDVSELLNDYVYSHHQEKIYVAHDREFYAPGETIWCVVHLVDGISHRSFDANPVVYANWLDPDGEVQGSYILKVDKGMAQFEIQTDANDEEGNYSLQVFSLYQRNFPEEFIFQKVIPLIGSNTRNSSNTLVIGDDTISFYPEGGHLITGVKSKIGFKIVGDFEIGNCRVVDNTGNFIATLDLMHEDMGIFSLKPEQGKSYYVDKVVDDMKERYPIPDAISKGYGLSASTIKEEHITVEIAAGPGLKKAGCRLIGHVRGMIFLDIVLKQDDNGVLLIPKTEVPSGVVHFTLFAKDGRPSAERLVFNKNDLLDPQVKVVMERENHHLRSKVEGRVMTSLEGHGEPSRMSLSIFKDYSENVDRRMGTNIVNYLLLQSDIDVPIKDINQYFLDDDRTSRALLDLLLMNLGWRKFNWQDVLANKRPDLVIRPEDSFSIAGRVLSRNSKKPLIAEITLNTLEEEAFSVQRVETDKSGLFVFSGLEWIDSTEIMLQAEEINERKKRKLKAGEIRRTGKKDVAIELIDLQKLDSSSQLLPQRSLPNNLDTERFKRKIDEIRKIDSIFNPDWRIDLDGFTVSAQRKTEEELKDSKLKNRYSEMGIPFVESSFKIYMDDLPSSGAYYSDIYDLIRARVPGATVTGSFGARERAVYFRGIQSITLPTYANFIVNGVPTEYNLVATINPANVLAIDVLKGLFATAFYGERGNGGIISIVTREPGDRIINTTRSIRGIINMKHPGYYQSRTFYSPDYSQPSAAHQKPDYRNTLYWSGALHSDDGSSEFSFYTGDESGTFQICVEGIASSGDPFVLFDRVVVEPGLNTDKAE